MIQQLLLGGQVLVIVLVYVFVWRVMRTARRDLAAIASGPPMVAQRAAGGTGAPAESTIIPAAEVARQRRAQGLGDPLVVVAASPVLTTGVRFLVGAGLTIGRAADNDVVIDDGVVSGHHARVVAPATLVDLDSTNGTLLNGTAVRGRAPLAPGDTIAIGETVLRFEVTS